MIVDEKINELKKCSRGGPLCPPIDKSPCPPIIECAYAPTQTEYVEIDAEYPGFIRVDTWVDPYNNRDDDPMV